jgi:hypothetical protein
LDDETGVGPTAPLLLCPHAPNTIVIPIREIKAIRFNVARLSNPIILLALHY